MRRLYIILTAAVLFFSCGGNGERKAFEPTGFPMTKVPSFIQEGPQSVLYLAGHFWDGFTDTSRVFPTDSSVINGVRRSEVEQNLANYIAILGRIPFDEASASVKRLSQKLLLYERTDTSSQVLEAMSELLSKYMYDPNSPLRNEDLYHDLATELSGYEGFSDAVRKKYAYDAKVTSLNRTGTVAADFLFSDKKGKSMRLHGIKADYTLLFFSNPGCEACKEIIESLDNQYVSDAISDGKIAVLNIYIDEDLTQWYEYMPVYPENWYNGYDPNMVLRDGSLYNVRAIPSLYLLDKDKTVIMKDAPLENVMAFLQNIVL